MNKSPDTRAALLQEAEQLIRTCGYSGFSYADLSAAVGVTKATIHHHFPTKEIMVSSALEVYRETYANAFLHIEAEHDNALDRLEAYASLYIAGLEQGFGCLCAALSVEHDILPERLKQASAAFFKDHLAWLEGIYASGLAQHEVNATLSAPDAARLVLSILEGSLLVERILRRTDQFQDTIRTMRVALSPN